MDFKTYLFKLPVAERVLFARRCKSTYGHLRNVAYGHKPCSAELAMEIERESKRAVPCESLCPGADWAVVRNSGRSRPGSKQAA
ncbi:MAG: hypothetical protein EKK49_07435 [Rhodocyclaceae bacterium]|nr:MAG: hypothetical protein EKK49_07435 [Rhodocyclaceae bacterium]